MKRLISLMASRIFFILFLITIFFIYFFAFSMIKAGGQVSQPFDCTKWERMRDPQAIVFGVGSDYYKTVNFKFAPYGFSDSDGISICRRYYEERINKTLWQTRVTKDGNEASLLIQDDSYFIASHAYTTWKLAEVSEGNNQKIVVIHVSVYDFNDSRLLKEQTFKIRIEPFSKKENRNPV